MTKSPKALLFSRAHTLTRKLVTEGISYRATFAMVLRDLSSDWDRTCIRVMNLAPMIEKIRNGVDMTVLPAIQAVSEKQAAFAAKVRDRRYPNAIRACEIASKAGHLTSAQADAIRTELRTNAEARFWLDVATDASPDVDPFYTLSPIARYLTENGRAPAQAA